MEGQLHTGMSLLVRLGHIYWQHGLHRSMGQLHLVPCPWNPSPASPHAWQLQPTPPFVQPLTTVTIWLRLVLEGHQQVCVWTKSSQSTNCTLLKSSSRTSGGQARSSCKCLAAQMGDWDDDDWEGAGSIKLAVPVAPVADGETKGAALLASAGKPDAKQFVDEEDIEEDTPDHAVPKPQVGRSAIG